MRITEPCHEKINDLVSERSDKHAVQAQKMIRGWKLWI